jgi:hypothetical protein
VEGGCDSVFHFSIQIIIGRWWAESEKKADAKFDED